MISNNLLSEVKVLLTCERPQVTMPWQVNTSYQDCELATLYLIVVWVTGWRENSICHQRFQLTREDLSYKLFHCGTGVRHLWHELEQRVINRFYSIRRNKPHETQPGVSSINNYLSMAFRWCNETTEPDNGARHDRKILMTELQNRVNTGLNAMNWNKYIFNCFCWVALKTMCVSLSI